MKRFSMLFLAVFFPWLALFLCDNPGGAIVALVMQATAIGWIPASCWAWRVVKRTVKEEKKPQPATGKS